MGLFKDFKEDFSQAVNELMPGEDNADAVILGDDVEVNTLEGDVDVEAELSKIDEMLEKVAGQVESKTDKKFDAKMNKFEQKKEEKKAEKVEKAVMKTEEKVKEHFYDTDNIFKFDCCGNCN